MNNTHHVLIESKDRTYGTPSDFRLDLSKSVFAKCISLSFCQFPNTYYNVTNRNNAIKFGISTYTITPGIYNLIELLDAIAALTENITCSFNDISQTITISNIAAFDIDLNIQNSMYQLIGFSKLAYTGASSYSGTFVPKLYQNAAFISINNISSGCLSSKSDFIQNFTFMIPCNTNKNEINQFYAHSQYNLRPYVNSVINHFQVKIYDEDGYLMENVGEWIMLLEIHN